jgi:hypothetical protein
MKTANPFEDSLVAQQMETLFNLSRGVKKLPVKELKDYHLFIKSNSEMPDYEDNCEAGSKEEAAMIFVKKTGRGNWDWQDLLAYIEEE